MGISSTQTAYGVTRPPLLTFSCVLVPWPTYGGQPDADRPLARFPHAQVATRRLGELSGRLELAPLAFGSPDLPLLGLLGWYLCLTGLAWDNAQGG